MERSEQIEQLAGALAAAQGLIENATKDSANPFFKSKYADLAAVWDAIRKPLSENGIAIIQSPSAEESAVTIITLLVHKSGQWIKSTLTVHAKDETPQAVGSAITYARRYALQSITGVAPEDDDGNGAQQGNRPGQQYQPPESRGSAAAARAVAEAKIAGTMPLDSQVGPTSPLDAALATFGRKKDILDSFAELNKEWRKYESQEAWDASLLRTAWRGTTSRT